MYRDAQLELLEARLELAMLGNGSTNYTAKNTIYRKIDNCRGRMKAILTAAEAAAETVVASEAIVAYRGI